MKFSLSLIAFFLVSTSSFAVEDAVLCYRPNGGDLAGIEFKVDQKKRTVKITLDRSTSQRVVDPQAAEAISIDLDTKYSESEQLDPRRFKHWNSDEHMVQKGRTVQTYAFSKKEAPEYKRVRTGNFSKSDFEIMKSVKNQRTPIDRVSIQGVLQLITEKNEDDKSFVVEKTLYSTLIEGKPNEGLKNIKIEGSYLELKHTTCLK